MKGTTVMEEEDEQYKAESEISPRDQFRRLGDVAAARSQGGQQCQRGNGGKPSILTSCKRSQKDFREELERKT